LWSYFVCIFLSRKISSALTCFIFCSCLNGRWKTMISWESGKHLLIVSEANQYLKTAWMNSMTQEKFFSSSWTSIMLQPSLTTSRGDLRRRYRSDASLYTCLALSVQSRVLISTSSVIPKLCPLPRKTTLLWYAILNSSALCSSAPVLSTKPP